MNPGVAAPEAPTQVGTPVRSWPTRRLKIVGLVIAGLQAIGLMLVSAHLYAHFDLTIDFAIFNQAWTLIAHGHLSPYSTLNPYNYPHYGYPYWSDHFVLIMWPMAILWFLYPHSIDLLVVQDLATAGCTLVAFLFVLDIIGERRATLPRLGRAVAGRWTVGDLAAVGAMVVLVANPWVYWAATFDFHLEAVATLFLLLAARDLWRGRRRRAIWWIVGVLLCGNVAATYLAGLGIALLVARKDLRWTGFGLVGLGIGWSLGVTAIGGGVGTIIGGNYGYLAGPAAGSNPSIFAIGTGALLHPTRPLRMIQTRWLWTYRMLASSGLVGVASGLGLGVAAVVLGANTLNAAAVFSGPISSFQALPVYYFVPVGSVVVLLWLYRSSRAVLRWTVLAVSLAIFVQAVILSAVWTPRARTEFFVVGGAAATRLATVQATIPADAEVVASQGVVGRFANRVSIYPFLDLGDGGQVIPVDASTVVFVLTTAGIEYATPAGTRSALDYLVHHHARLVSQGAGVYELVWHPAPDARWLTIPPASAG